MNRDLRVLLTMLSAALAVGGCDTLTHKEAKMAAERRWCEMRGRVTLQLARQQFDGMMFREAIETATEALALEPTLVEGYVLVAKANLELGKNTSAARAIEAAGRLGLKSPALVYLEGVVLEQRGGLDEALDRYDLARSLDPDNIDYHVAAVECLVALGRSDLAMQRLQDAAFRFDDTATNRVLTAQVALLIGDDDLAAHHFARAVVGGDVPELVQEQHGLLLARRGACAEAVVVLEPLIESRSDAWLVRRALATCYMTLGRPARAEEILVVYTAEHPEDARAHVLLAQAALAAGDLLTALRAVSEAERLTPHRPQIVLLRATIEWSRGNSAAAVASLAPLLANDAGDVDAHCLMAEILLTQADRPGARAHFQRAIQLDPASVWARRGLDTL